MHYAIILSPEWPGRNGGYQLAIYSSLKYYSQVYSNLLFISVTKSLPTEETKEFSNVTWQKIPIEPKSKILSFLKGSIGNYPGVIQKYNKKKYINTLENFIMEALKTNILCDLIIEDIPLAFILLKSKLLNNLTIKKIVRSHNVLGEIFEGFKNNHSIVMRIPWSIEQKKCEKLEKNIYENCDELYAISCRDKREYLKRYNFKVKGIIGVGLNIIVRNKHISNINNIIHIGTVDLRKTHGLKIFINKSWIKILKKKPHLNLLIAGKNTEKFTNAKANIKGLGFINNDKDFFKQGQIFVNPQLYGSGIKIKSLVAMLHMKTLVTTKKGIEGIEGKDGVHFFIAESDEDFVDIILKLVNNVDLASIVANNGYELIKDKYNIENIHKIVRINETNTTII